MVLRSMFGVGQRGKCYGSGCLSSGWTWTALVNTPSKAAAVRTGWRVLGRVLATCRKLNGRSINAEFWHVKVRGVLVRQLKQNFDNSKYVGF